MAKLDRARALSSYLALLSGSNFQLPDGSGFRGGVGSLNGRAPTYLLGREVKSVRRPSPSRAGLSLTWLLSST